ncbi:MAG: FG-GAP-like repeat-containing protein [Candidatus Marinimicrobia bacterium]|nr:FG-GAP-like repeat-containing protein [Candidatus Neomarinimicrobiota bacterium]MCF7828394.1 FG-GAP-like repeat-containing protein [Candidatus Neomarinimicrobiota bacterium]MCF7881012.1 FG-GAP-like repeat-containing protein [Candidatus Neomarinimicrobiota bacterium]
MMKFRISLVILCLIIYPIYGFSQNYFQVVYSGNPYLAMNIYVTSATIDGIPLEAGDEVGIFDGEYCVGMAQLAEPISDYLSVKAATDDPNTTEIDGFTPGNQIQFRIWDQSEGKEYLKVVSTLSSGSETFQSQGTGVVSIAAKPLTLVAAFSATPVSGNAPLEVQFTDESTASETQITQWKWDLNDDGVIDGTEQNPGWTYTAPGTYSVKLIVSDGTISDTLLINNYITVTEPPEPGVIYAEDFSSDPNFTTEYTTKSGEYFEWDSVNEIYKIRILDEHQVLKYVYTPKFKLVDAGDFEFQIDLKLVETSYGMPIGLRLFHTDLSDLSKTWAIFHKGSHDPDIKIGDGSGNAYSTNNVMQGNWYRIKVIYDDKSGTANLTIIDLVSDEVFFKEDNVPFNPANFSQIALGWNTLWAEGSVGEMHYDNIIIKRPGMVVESIQPEPHTGNIPTTTDIEINFSHPVDASTLMSENLIVTGKYTGIYHGVMNLVNNGSTVVYTPNSPFKVGERISVLVSDNIYSANGEQLSRPIHSSFTVHTTSGDGVFSGRYDLSTGMDVISVKTADLNKDQTLDLAVIHQKSDSLSIYLGSGSGNFILHSRLPLLVKPSDLIINDFDQDNYLDIAVSHYTGNVDNMVSVYFGVREGHFNERVDVNTGSPMMRLQSGDINLDGYPDIAVANTEGYVTLLQNQKGRSFITSILDEVYNAFPNSIDLADHNNDGFLDLSVGYKDRNDMSLFLGNGDGSFQSMSDLGYSVGCYTHVLDDFDGDDLVDLVTGGRGNEVNSFKGNGDGTFTKSGTLTLSDWAYTLYPGDIDSDGDMDIVVTEYRGNRVLSLMNTGGFSFQIEIISQSELVGPIKMDGGDLNKDGSLDLIIPNQGSDYLSVFFGKKPSPPIGYYPFNGNAEDASGNDNDGDVNGPVLTTDRFGNNDSAYWFDGNNDYIVTTDGNGILNEPLNKITVSAWIHPESYNTGYIYRSTSQDGIFHLNTRDTGLIECVFALSNGEKSVSSNFSLNKWYHVVGQWDGNKLSLYVNGEIVDSSTAIGALSTQSVGNSIGANSDGSLSFHGKIDEVRLFDRVLTTNELNELYTPSTTIQISIDSMETRQGDTLSLPIRVLSPQSPKFSTIEFFLDGYQSGLKFIGIDTANTLTGKSKWSYVIHETNKLAISWIYGATPIETNGVFAKLQFVATGQPCELYPVILDSVMFDTGLISVKLESGGVYITPLPDFGDVDGNGRIQADDTALILEHVIGLNSLVCQDSANAEVTLDHTISALDASLVAQYRIGNIENLPYDSTELSIEGQGTVSLQDQGIVRGTPIEVPIYLQNGINIFSFETEMEYDPAFLELNGFELSNQTAGFSYEFNNTNGILKIAGAGKEPTGTTGSIGAMQFVVSPNPPSTQTEIVLNWVRINENPIKMDISHATLDVITGILDNSLPTEFVLFQNHPNPFNPSTTFRYGLPEEASVRLLVYDLMGRKVRTLVAKEQDAGWYEIEWNGTNDLGNEVSSGVYFYFLESGDFVDNKKMVYMK